MCLFNWISFIGREATRPKALGRRFPGLLSDHYVYYSGLKQTTNKKMEHNFCPSAYNLVKYRGCIIVLPPCCQYYSYWAAEIKMLETNRLNQAHLLSVSRNVLSSRTAC